MVPPALTIRIFSYYVLVVGVSLILLPSLVPGWLGIEVDERTWVRVLGLAVVVLGVYYFMAAQNEATWFFRVTIATRIGIAAGLALLAVTAGPTQLIFFGVLDLAGALWTRRALHKTERWA